MSISNKNQEITHLSIPPQVTQSHPWLLMINGVQKERQTYYSISKGCYYTRNIPELVNKKIFSNCMEWLVLVDEGNMECSLLNIISMEKIGLPKYDEKYLCLCCNLTCLPGDPNCRVVFIDNFHLSISICRPGDDMFITGKMQLLEDDLDFWSATCFDGRIYAIGFPSFSMIKANLNDPTLEFQTVIHGNSIQKELLDVTSCHYLTESCGEFLMVTKSTLHEESCVFHVFIAEFSTLKWVHLKSIGDRAIFLQPRSMQGISCSSSESGLRGNCIYYTEECSKTIYVFDLEDQSLTMITPCPTINPVNVTPYWVMIPPTNVL